MSTLDRVLERLERTRQEGRGHKALCPAHADVNPSLSVLEADDGKVLLRCHAGCDTEEILKALGLDWRDLFPEDSSPTNGARRIVATYDYRDEAGELLYQGVRYDPKDFRQRRPDGSGWAWKLNGTRRVLYRLAEVMQAVERGEPVWVVEGEKDADALSGLGFTATTNAGGAEKWRPEYTDTLSGADVVICGDRDEAGRKHVQQVAEALTGTAREVRVLFPPDSTKDVGEFVADVRSDDERGEVRKLLLDAVSRAPIFLSTTKESTVVETNGMLPFAPMVQALSEVPAEPEWLWHGYVAPGCITLIAGRPKVGKSTLAFGVLEALGKGEAFVSLQASQAGVLLLSEERPDTLAEKQRRFNLNGSVDLLMRHQVRDTPWSDVVDQAVRYCEEREISVLVVDTWDKWASLAGDSENSAGHVLEALEPLLRAAGKGLAVVIVAHQRKAAGTHGEAVRGNNALTGGVDVVIEVERPTSDVSPTVRILRAISRFACTSEELAVDLTEDGYRACGNEEAVKVQVEKSRTWDALCALEESDAKAVAELVEVSDSTARRRLNELVEEGYAQRSGEGKRTLPTAGHSQKRFPPTHIS